MGRRRLYRPPAPTRLSHSILLRLSRPAAIPRAVILRSTTMATGTVKWFNTTKGYGFIAPEGGSKDVFVHISAVECSGLTGLQDNQKVSYEQSGRDGRESAINLELL